MNKDLLKHIAKIMIAILLLSSCFYLLDFSLVMRVLSETGYQVYLSALLITIIGTIIIPAVITKKSLSVSSLDMLLLKLIQINFAIRFYILILPRAIAVGMRWYRYKQTGTGADAAALIMFERVIQLLIVSLVATFFVFFDIDILKENGVFLILIIGSISVVFIFLFYLFVSSAFSGFIDKYFMKYNQYLPAVISTKVDKLWQSIILFHKISKTIIVEILVLSIIGYILFISAGWIIAEGMGIDITLQSLIWIRSVVFIITLIPFSVGGIGVRDVSLIYFLGLYGVENESAFAFSLAMLGIQLFIGLMGVFSELFRMFIVKLDNN